jgi:crotonobetainyl-CoA:carnitine CoA-transferase CaiB-like acyl-CoA transferase
VPGALEGIRVVDATSGIAGAMAGMILSDHGADVIKVEPPGGDPTRRYGGSVVWHRGRRSVVLDLETAEGRSRLTDLIATTDVFVESFPPGRTEGWLIDYASLEPEFPSLVHASLTGYVRGTDAADRPAIDLLVQARSGEQFEQPGWRDGPIFLPRPLPSLGASFLLLNGIVAALYAREVTGKGQHVETSLYQGVLAFTTQLWQDFEHESANVVSIGREPQPSIYECADGLWVHSMHAAGGRGKDKSAFWDIMGLDPGASGSEIVRIDQSVLRDAFRRIPRQEVLDQFWANGLAIAPVRSAAEALDDPLLAADGWITDIEDPELGPTRQLGLTFHLQGVDSAQPTTPRPAIGQHTDEVLAELPREQPRARRVRTGRPLSHALEGISVLDLGNFLAGPFGPMLLGDLGATVYKLESPAGDQMRAVTKPFNGCQRGKLDVVADLKTPDGRAIAHRLIERVDVVHHNMRPGVAERLGVGYETARSLNPDIIYCQTTMWGVDGPRATWPGFDQLGQASCGLELELGGQGNPPVWYRFGMCDQACACQSAVAVLLALYWREKTGKGQFVDTSIVSGGMYYSSDQWNGTDGPFRRPQLDSNQTGFGPLYRLYEASDGWIALACLGERHWASLCSAFPDLATDERFATAQGRAQHPDALSDAIERLVKQLSAEEAFRVLDEHGVPVEVAAEEATRSWFSAKDLVAAGLVADYQHPQYGRFRQFGHLVHFSETPGRIGGPPPLLGEHSWEVLSELGYTSSEIEELRRSGVTTWPE